MKWAAMTSFHSLFILVLSLYFTISCARGTEVGNGNQPGIDDREVDETSKQNQTDSPDDQGVPASNTSGGEGEFLLDVIDWIFAPCASVFKEASDQSLSNESIFIEVVQVNQKRLVRFEDDQIEISRDDSPGAGNYAVLMDKNINSYEYSCIDLESGNASENERRFRIEVGGQSAVVSWIFDQTQQLVTTLKIESGEKTVTLNGNAN